MKIDWGTRTGWLVGSVAADFVSAAFLMLALGSLGHHWGYWHAWWVTFAAGSALGTVIYPITTRIEYLIEHQR